MSSSESILIMHESTLAFKGLLDAPFQMSTPYVLEQTFNSRSHVSEGMRVSRQKRECLSMPITWPTQNFEFVSLL